MTGCKLNSIAGLAFRFACWFGFQGYLLVWLFGLLVGLTFWIALWWLLVKLLA